MAQLSLLLEFPWGVSKDSPRLTRVTLVLVPSCEGEFSDISLMKFWVIFIHFTGNGFFGSQACITDGANLNICECYNESDRLQLSFNTGIIFSFLHVHVRSCYSEAGVYESVCLWEVSEVRMQLTQYLSKSIRSKKWVIHYIWRGIQFRYSLDELVLKVNYEKIGEVGMACCITRLRYVHFLLLRNIGKLLALLFRLFVYLLIWRIVKYSMVH